MQLVILDIDGTLTETNGVDGDCFVQAVTECCGIDQIDTDWSSYQHTTDAGIVAELFQRQFRTTPSSAEITNLITRFLALLQQAQQATPAAFKAVAGAAALLASLEQHKDWAAVIATGSWEESARFKLAAAKLKVTCPVLSSAVGPSREAILQAAIAAACEGYGVSSFTRTVSVGDGQWDVRTAWALGLPFIGVGTGMSAARLKQLGASHVLPDLADLDAVYEALAQAVVPDYPVMDQRQRP